MIPDRDRPPSPPQSLYDVLMWSTIALLTLIVLVLITAQ